MRSRKGFSLIELLVILALFAMLASFFLPAVTSLRKAAERTECMNNLKQLSLAYNNWRSVNPNDKLPVATWVKTLDVYFERNEKTLLCPTIMSARAISSPITGMTATAKSNWDVTQTPASRTIDGSGLSGNSQTHGNDYRHMWLSDDAGPAGQWLSLNLEGTYKVSHVQIWNYNQEGRTWRGVQSCDIQVSMDNATWNTVAAGVKLAQAPGNADVHFETVQLPGSPSARYVRILVTANFVGKDKHVGLSEVQVVGNLQYADATHYGVNAFIGTVKRITNTSGTIAFLEYNQPVADMTAPAKYPDFMRPAGIAGRHPAPMLNVAFVDGHVDFFAASALNPLSKGHEATVGEEMWNNYLRNRD